MILGIFHLDQHFAVIHLGELHLIAVFVLEVIRVIEVDDTAELDRFNGEIVGGYVYEAWGRSQCIRLEGFDSFERNFVLLYFFFGLEEQMPGFGFRFEVALVERIRFELDFACRDHVQIHAFHGFDLVGIVSQQHEIRVNLEDFENIGNSSVFSIVFLHSEVLVSRKRVTGAVGELFDHTGSALADVAATTAFLDKVEKDTVLFFDDFLQSAFELKDTVAIQAAHGFGGHAAGVYTGVEFF